MPLSAREALDKSEVQRQSILFEIIKSEREYVADLELVKEVRRSIICASLAPFYYTPGIIGVRSYTLKLSGICAAWIYDQCHIAHEVLLT